MRAAIALIFAACLLVAGALAAGAASLDMRGSWTLDVKVGSNRSVQTLEIASMDLGSGTFRGNLIASAQRASVAGTVSGSKVTFQTTPSTGSAAKWVGDLQGNGLSLKMSGTFTPDQGQAGTFSGSRVTAAVPLDGQGSGKTQSGRPPLPQNGRELSPGQLPRPCTTGEVGMQGYYFSETAKQWVAAPFCYGKWGNLDASGSQIVVVGASVTVTAIPNDGSNSGTYAPQTGSIQWEHPGQVVSGCGAADLSCTVIPTKLPSTEWQWFQFHVSMPRTFFIDSPGDLCGGQHLCAGASTNAWTYVGVAPAGTAAPGSASTDQAPAVIGGGGPAGGQGTGGGGGPPVGLILGTAAVLGIGAAGLAARRNPLGASAATMRRLGEMLSGTRATGKSGGATTSTGGATTPNPMNPSPESLGRVGNIISGMAGPAGKGGGKGAGMSQIDLTSLAQQFGQMPQATQSGSPSSSPPPAASGTPDGGGGPPAPPPPVSPEPPH